MRMKKTIAAFAVSALLIGTLAGCTGSETDPLPSTITIDGYTVNQAYNSTEMQSISGNKYHPKGNPKTICEKLNGIGITISDDMEAEIQSKDNILMAIVMNEGIIVTAGTEKLKEIGYPSEEEMKNMTDEEWKAFQKQMNQNTVYLFGVLREDPDMDDPEYFQSLKEQFDTIDKLVEYDGATYYFGATTDLSKYDLTEVEKEKLNRFVGFLDEAKDNVCLFKAAESDAPNAFKGTLNKFAATTMSGNEIDQSIFADYDITMVNVWATWCGYCVEELPDIQKLYEQLPENVNIISICTDASTETELAQSMIDETDIQFETLINNDELEEIFIKYCEALPTTVFVDSQGNVVGNVQTGLPGEDIISGYSALIDQALATIGRGGQ